MADVRTSSARLRAIRTRVLGFFACAVLIGPAEASAYSVLAHEAAIDATWDSSLRPLLLRRYPHTSPAALNVARSYAYGGSVIQDLGYYPFGNKFFSNLLHYTRSGDFVEALLRDEHDVNELAFALGALAHYVNDNTGHPEAVNRSVPMVFPKLRAKFGDVITYERAPAQHVIVEFSFDVAHTAQRIYPLAAYRSLIGFRVATPLLERAFRETYHLEMSDLFADRERTISTYRYAVSQIIPALTRAAWRDKREEILATSPALPRDAFVLAYTRADFEREFGRDYQKPALFARFLAFIYRLVPKIGPLKPLTFKAPPADAGRLFVESVRDANARLRSAIADLRDGRIELPNRNFDTGGAMRHGEYALADDTYGELLGRLADRKFAGVSAALRRNIVAFYGDRPQAAPGNRKERRHWRDIESDLETLRRLDGPSSSVASGR